MSDDITAEASDCSGAEQLNLAFRQLFINAITSRNPINAGAEAARILRELPERGRTEEDIRREIVAAAIARGIPIQL
ncbi:MULTISPECIES: hypothetical protein [unclassified Chelatococcus]|uniref:hypothetical protein n=1 Tax=unclassified Chelatococcus TaxID=2638111 RepID=UPI001BCE4617|nr:MULTISPECIES: hypothetical protein [unclassified Chelatococcus]MBS7700792.1 hypothetical protein [Chelatococcus sp. YT9]MBX3559650.1 hypothetical protein [Chelatococcus sp.]